LGPVHESPPIQCWKCGLFFGCNASNKPIVRPVLDHPRRPIALYYGALAVPFFVPFFIRGGDWSLVGYGGFFLLWLTGFVYCLDWLTKTTRDGLWLVAVCAFVLAHLGEVFRFFVR